MARAGAYRWGVADATEVSAADSALYDGWIDSGRHGCLGYMERHAELRRNPEGLLPGVRSVIVCAFPYSAPPKQPEGTLKIASYALGDDYHDVIRRRLAGAAVELGLAEGHYRVCVDTAPLRERYWAVQAGVGFIGQNCQLIVPDAGSRFFIGVLLTTERFAPSAPCRLHCAGCRRCVACCPAGALTGGARPELDARRCLSCLTIEHRGPLPDGHAPLGRRLYGCDTCQDVCPHNIFARPTHPLTGEPLPAPLAPLAEFEPRADLLALTRDEVLALTPERYALLTRRSAIKRAKLDGLRRNASAT